MITRPIERWGRSPRSNTKSRAERYDTQLRNIIGVDPENLSTERKMAHLRQYREDQYESLLDAVYKRRGWDKDSIPTPEKMRALGIDLPEVLHVITWAKEQV